MTATFVSTYHPPAFATGPAPTHARCAALIGQLWALYDEVTGAHARRGYVNPRHMQLSPELRLDLADAMTYLDSIR